MSDQIQFTKMQGVGNDFVVIDGRNEMGCDWSTLAIEMCDRRFGIGADGLLVLDNTQQADVMMRMYNPDGTPDVCGNGLRCVAKYAVERGVVAKNNLKILTLAGVRNAELLFKAEVGSSAVSSLVRVSMGTPRFIPADIPMRVIQDEVVNYPLELEDGSKMTITALSTGSTHVIAFVESLPDDDVFFKVSPQVENHPLFPERTSLMWAQPEGDNRLKLRIWERGAGETWGCGTGACAAAVAAIRQGYAQSGVEVSVLSKGGVLSILWQEGGVIQMTGPAEFVYEGSYPK